MTTHCLHGNHDPCAACELRRELQDTAPVIRDPIPCNVCGGSGYLPLTDAEIVRRTVAEAQAIIGAKDAILAALEPEGGE